MIEFFGIVLDSESQLDGLGFPDELLSKPGFVFPSHFFHEAVEIQQKWISPGSVLQDVADARKAVVGKMRGGEFLIQSADQLSV